MLDSDKTEAVGSQLFNRHHRRRNLGVLLSSVFLGTLVGCGTNGVNANSPGGIRNCNTWGEVKYNRDQQGSNTSVKSAAELRREVGAEVTTLAARTIAKGGKINFDDGAGFLTRDSTGTYSIAAERTSLTLKFPQLDFHKYEEVTFHLEDNIAVPVENAAVMCSSDNGTVYPNGVAKLMRHIMSKTAGLDTLTK